MVIPLIAITGGVVDYGRAVKTKAQLLTALDASILAAMLQYSLDDETDYKKVVTDYIKKNLTEADKTYQGLELDITVPDITEEGELKATLSTSVTTNFLRLVGFDQFDITIQSAAMVGGNKLDLALVLDNTGSMKGDKLTALKAAAHDLIDTVMPDEDNEKIKVSLIPFADYVNIGNTGDKDADDDPIVINRSEPGLDIPSDYSFTPPGDNCWNSYPDSTQECTNDPQPETCYNDGVPYDCMESNWSCTGDKGEAVEVCEPHEERNYKWHGCVGSRVHDLNVLDEDYGTGVPGIMYEGGDWCSEIAMAIPLTSSKSAVGEAIDSMVADDRKTYIPSGLSWGWRMLSPLAPFTQGAAEDDESVKRVIVLMTDGANTRRTRKWTGLETEEDSWEKDLGWRAQNNSSEVWGHDRSDDGTASNPITAELCENIKAKDIVIYTIGFEISGGSDVENLMKACAGNGGKYYDADNGTELAEAFKEIGESLLNLRLSQ